MQLRYDEAFVEGAVFVCANSRLHSPPALQVRRFHRAREKCYDILEPDERNAVFFKVHLDWFREWGFEEILISPLDDFSLLRNALNALVFRTARTRNDEGAELYVHAETGRAGVVALRVERFEQLDNLGYYLRHEFSHLQDMVNPAFGYSPQFHLPGRNLSQQRLIRERYRLLWDITIDGRLSISTCSANKVRVQHRAAFDRAFNFWPETKRDEVFDSLWESRQSTHDALLAIASDPRQLESQREPVPGAACPLCGFATFSWADISKLLDSTAAAIQAEFPDWLPAHGACQRCVAIYRLRGVASLAVV